MDRCQATWREPCYLSGLTFWPWQETRSFWHFELQLDIVQAQWCYYNQSLSPIHRLLVKCTTNCPQMEVSSLLFSVCNSLATWIAKATLTQYSRRPSQPCLKMLVYRQHQQRPSPACQLVHTIGYRYQYRPYKAGNLSIGIGWNVSYVCITITFLAFQLVRPQVWALQQSLWFASLTKSLWKICSGFICWSDSKHSALVHGCEYMQWAHTSSHHCHIKDVQTIVCEN